MIKAVLKHWPLLWLVVVYVLFSLLTARDFGVAWDEQEIYARSAFLINYLLGRVDYNLYLKDTYGLFYNHLHGLFLVLLNPKGTFGIYHFLNMLFAVPMYVTAYLLLYKKYKQVVYAIIGPAFLLLIPNLLGHMPINPKDGSFAVYYFISLCAIYLLRNFKNPSAKILLLGVMFGFAQSARIIGFTLFIIFPIYELFFGPQRINIHKFVFIASQTVAIFVVANFVLVVSWPYLGANYLAHMVEIFNSAKSYPWNGSVLFDGIATPASELPNTYLPKLFLITTPLFILTFFGWVAVKAKKIIKDDMLFLFMFAFTLNVFLYFSLRPVVYDGLRHYLFLLPIIGLVSAIGFIDYFKSSRKTILKKLVLIFVVVNVLKVVFEMIVLHPYEYVYFNEIVGGLPGAYEKYETEYMGISHKDAIMWLKKSEISGDREYFVVNCGHPFSGMYYLRDNMRWTEKVEEADYHVCYTRFNNHLAVSNDKTIYIIKRFGVPINFIRKL